MTGIHWMRPEWLWTLVPALLLLMLLWRQRGRSGSWQSVIAPELLRHLVSDTAVSRGRNLLPLVFLGWVLAALAAAGPSWQKIPQPVHQKQDALVVLLDLSLSMNVADLAPSRLDRARQKLLDLLQHRREGQTGLIAYAGDAHIVTPLTDDTPTIANLLPALNPGMMPVPGSEPVSAVSQALELLRSAGIRGGRILLVTDGVSERDRAGIEKVLAGSDAQLAVMGVGTPSGAPIPLPNGGFIKDDKGTIVMPGLDEQGLRALAAATGGTYRRIQIDDSDLDALLRTDPLDDREDTLALDRTADTWEDQGYLLILALLPLALALFRRGWLLGLLPALLPALLLVQPEPASAQSWDDLWLTPDQQGQRALQQGNAEAAASLFKNPDWAGTAAYQSGDYEAAVEKFTNAQDANSLYNRGNALARAGKLDQAIAAYEESLKLQPEQADASDNLELLKKLKEQQQQQQGEQQQGEEQKQDQEQQGQGKGQEQNQRQDQGEKQEQEQIQQQDQGEQQTQQQNQQQGQEQSQQQDQGRQQDEQQDQSEQQNAQAEGKPEESEQAAGEEQAQQATAQPEDGETDDAQQAQPPSAANAGEEEQDQAMQQWLRRVPDDPSGLLRQKFRYESLQRQQQGVGKDDDVYW
jgi:Ca-activated chloride channel family protein